MAAAATAMAVDAKSFSSEPPPTRHKLENDPSSPDDDLYSCFKSLQRQNEFTEIQDEYVKDEVKNLRRELLRSQEEVTRIQSVPLVIGQFMEMIDQNNAIVGSTTGSNYYVRILSTINRELLKPSASVALRPFVNCSFVSGIAELGFDLDIGGCDIQKQEIREAVELPLTHHELYQQIGIDPPRGVLLYGPPGTGKTMLAKAVAHHTTASFIRVVGSEFVQKYLGEGPRMVRDVFRLAKENAPAIIFVDEVDAIATARFDAQTGADREVQRILMELLNQMDGFDQTVNVKVIMATNRADTLDPALLRPGRLDRKIEFPLPDRRQKRLVFQVCTAKMNLSDEVDLEDYVSRPDKISAAEIAAICQEAGMLAVRKNRYVILPKDFEKGYRSNVKKPDTDFEFYNNNKPHARPPISDFDAESQFSSAASSGGTTTASRRRRHLCGSCCACASIATAVLLAVALLGGGIYFAFLQSNLPEVRFQRLDVSNITTDGETLTAASFDARLNATNGSGRVELRYVEMTAEVLSEGIEFPGVRLPDIRQSPHGTSEIRVRAAARRMVVEEAAGKDLKEKAAMRVLVVSVVVRGRISYHFGGRQIDGLPFKLIRADRQQC
ncbi:26S protease regulatory subunit 6B homolog [Striga asiatica]|uniref:26S protease regulatory subunit 6B homolog n=1 Tax=Striga asiatica TaxID=4170 RepID=A0A5A7RDX4_STRAF|nr:26S protease regulatory subunit 6B homolog [Striga asiatica]